MIQDRLILRTSISSKLMTHTLFKGFVFSLIGSLGLLYGGVYANLFVLQTWGFTLFIICLSLITIGMLPYRRLTRLQLKPDELCLVTPNQLEFYSRGKKLLTLSLQAISYFKFIDHGVTLYGIAVWLKPQAARTPVIVHGSRKEVDLLRQQGKVVGDGADLFFPYFNWHAFQELVEWQKAEQQLD